METLFLIILLASCLEPRYTIYCKRGGTGEERFMASFAFKSEAEEYIENTKGCRIEETNEKSGNK